MEDEATRTLELDTKTIFFFPVRKEGWGQVHREYTTNTQKERKERKKKLTKKQTVHKFYNIWNQPESWIVNISRYMLLSFLMQFNLKTVS